MPEVMSKSSVKFFEREACAVVAEVLVLVGADSREFRETIARMEGPRNMGELGLVWHFYLRGKLGKVRWLRAKCQWEAYWHEDRSPLATMSPGPLGV